MLFEKLQISFFCFVSAKLNLTYLNKAAKQGEKKLIRITDLVIDRCYIIKAIREVKTKNGLKYVIDMINNQYFFVPDSTSEWLLENTINLKKMIKLIEKKQVGFKRISPRGIEFLNMTRSLLNDSDSENMFLSGEDSENPEKTDDDVMDSD